MATMFNSIPLLNSIKPKLTSNFSICKNHNHLNLNLNLPKFTRSRPFSSSKLNLARESIVDYYKILKVAKGASKKDIKESFYKLSKLYHPDAASSSNQDIIEDNTAKFHALSEAYATLQDDVARRNYDRSLLGYHRPTYTSATTNSQSGFGGGAASSWSSENNSRRERANYAWAHPTRRGNGESNSESAAASARARTDPFRGDDSNTSAGSRTTMDDHFSRFSKQQARTHTRVQAKVNRFANNGSPFSSGAAGFSGFGAKAEEESRLVNDSGVKRSGSVFLIFAAAFTLAISFSSGKSNSSGSNSNQNQDRRRK